MKPVTCVVCGKTEPWRHGHWEEWRTGRGVLAFHCTCMIGLLEQLDRERRSGQPELFGPATAPAATQTVRRTG